MEVQAIAQATATAMDCALVGLAFARYMYKTISLVILAVNVW